jgi:hypothetical protein
LSDQVEFTSVEGITGTLVVTQPDHIQVGDTYDISLKFAVDQELNKLNQLTLLSRFEMANLKVVPNGEAKVSIDPSKSVVLNWQLTPYQAGAFSGTMWLFIEIAEGERDLILAKPIELQAKTLFGFSYQSARTVSIVGLIVGIGFCLVFINKKRSV